MGEEYGNQQACAYSDEEVGQLVDSAYWEDSEVKGQNGDFGHECERDVAQLLESVVLFGSAWLSVCSEEAHTLTTSVTL